MTADELRALFTEEIKEQGLKDTYKNRSALVEALLIQPDEALSARMLRASEFMFPRNTITYESTRKVQEVLAIITPVT